MKSEASIVKVKLHVQLYIYIHPWTYRALDVDMVNRSSFPIVLSNLSSQFRLLSQ